MQTQIVSVHAFRRVARKEERRIQELLDSGEAMPDVPTWARGAKVQKAGTFQHAVVLTENKGT